MPEVDQEELARISAGGWDSFEEGTARVRAAAEAIAKVEMEKRRAERAMVRGALSTPDGKRLLEWLEKNTIKCRPGEAELMATTAEAYAIAKARREGQNAIWFKLDDLLAEQDGDKETVA